MLSKNLGAYGALVLSLVVCRLILSSVPLEFKTPGQQSIFGWWALAGVSAWGLVGVGLLRPTGFEGIHWRPGGIRIAASLGIVTGLLNVGLGWLDPAERVLGVTSAHHPMPEGLLFYWYAGVISEIWFHLVPAPLVVFAVSNIALRGRHQVRVFWIALIILSGWEGRRYFASPDWRDGIELARFVVAYTANAFGIWLFRYYGFTAALLQRMSGYAIWHVAWPLLRV